MAESDAASAQAKLRVGPGGRVVIPAPMREALGVGDGDVLIAEMREGELRITSMSTALARARALVREVVPAGVSLSDELLADRRREVERESRE